MNGLYRTLFPPFRPSRELQPRGVVEAPELLLSWLGTAGHVVKLNGRTVLIDPFLTRPSLWRSATQRLRPDEAALARHLPSGVDAIVCGHSHYDHLLDAPLIARRTGALLIGSRSTCAVARASGVPEAQLVELPALGGIVPLPPLTIRLIPSRHGRLGPFGKVPFPGETSRPSLPARIHQYRMGGAFGVLVSGPRLSLYHNGSADLVDAALEGHRADVLVLGLAGRRRTASYVSRITSLLQPGLIVPTHHDAFFAPLERGLHLLPGIDLDGFCREAGAAAPDARLVMPGYLEPLSVPSTVRQARLPA